MRPGTDDPRRALTACFREHQATVHGVVHDRCGDPALAEEITAQTFEAAARQFANGRGDEVTAGWLIVVAKRRLVDHWRHMAARARAVERLGGVRAEGTQPMSPGLDSDITVALEALPARQRTVLTLRYLDDWGLDEIAEGLDISYRAAESLLARARRTFTTALRNAPGSAANAEPERWTRRSDG